MWRVTVKTRIRPLENILRLVKVCLIYTITEAILYALWTRRKRRWILWPGNSACLGHVCSQTTNKLLKLSLRNTDEVVMEVHLSSWTWKQGVTGIGMVLQSRVGLQSLRRVNPRHPDPLSQVTNWRGGLHTHKNKEHEDGETQVEWASAPRLTYASVSSSYASVSIFWSHKPTLPTKHYTNITFIPLVPETRTLSITVGAGRKSLGRLCFSLCIRSYIYYFCQNKKCRADKPVPSLVKTPNYTFHYWN